MDLKAVLIWTSDFPQLINQKVPIKPAISKSKGFTAMHAENKKLIF